MEYLVFFGAAILFVLFMVVKGTIDAQKEKAKFVRYLYDNYGELPRKEYIPGKLENIAKFYERHPKEGQLDQITWNDLNLEEIYKRVNYTYSSAGEEYLYYTLRTPEFSEEPLIHREELIRYFMEHPEERVELQSALKELGYSGKFSIYEYLENLDILGERNNRKHYLADFLFLPCNDFGILI